MLSQNWKDLVKKARAKQLQPNEYSSGMELMALHSVLDFLLQILCGHAYLKILLFAGTFTLSNLGMFGVDRFDAILPPGQVSLIPFLPSLYKS